MSAAAAVDPARCPLCGQPNQCAMACGTGPAAGACCAGACGTGGASTAAGTQATPCWCTTASFPPDLLGRVPDAARGRACICPACAGRGA